MESFLSWSEEQGITTNATVKKTQYAGYGLFSSEKIHSSAPTVLVHIPNHLLLTLRKALSVSERFSEAILKFFSRNDEIIDDIEQVAQNSENERQVLCLFLIYCQFFDRSTLWEPYISILPSIEFFKENHVLFNLESIKGTTLENSTHAKIASLKRELQAITKTEDTWISDIDFDMYIWADCVFWSRAVGIGGDDACLDSNMALVPFFDFANHSADKSNMRWQLNQEQKGLDLVTYPDQTIKNGDELLLSYGSKPNQELLFLHGFCIENNPEPSCITLPLLPFLDPTADPLNLPKIHWLKQIGVKPTLKLTVEKQNDVDQDLIGCGWMYDSIVTMYLVALDEDDGLVFAANEDSDTIQLLVQGKNISTMKELENAVINMDHSPIIKLRVIVLLLDALGYQYSQNTEFEGTEMDEIPITKQASIYRNEEKCALESALETLSDLQDKLMKNSIVLSYLEGAQ
jgi:hypothetical protein